MGCCFFKKNMEVFTEFPRRFFWLEAKDINGDIIQMKTYQDYKLILIVNVASKCLMYTNSYKKLN